jgi:tetratricopeptide (TPR) repeat protein
MERGLALLNGGDRSVLAVAVRCFEEAIDLRRRLPLPDHPGFRFGLSSGWINRGDALARLGGEGNLVEAVCSYDAAIELLREVPAGDDGSFVQRLAIAWMNRGLALDGQESEAARREAISSYEKAIAVLGHSHSPGGDARRDIVLAMAWVNLGNAQLRFSGSEMATRACRAMENALPLLTDFEAKEIAAAEAALKARHILCQAIAGLLAAPHDEAAREMDLVCRMTDALEDGLKLARNWEAQGVMQFRPLATQLFQAGAMVYEKQQPQFLADYLLDHVDPERVGGAPPLGEGWLEFAGETVSRAIRRVMGGDFGWLVAADSRQRLEILKGLQAAENRLQRLTQSLA